MSRRWVALGFCIAIPAIAVAVLVARRLTGLPTLIILGSGLVFIFLFDLALAFTLPHFAKHKTVRDALVLLLLPMPVLAVSAFLMGSERTFRYGSLFLLLGIVLQFLGTKSSLAKLRKVKEGKTRQR